MLYERRPRPIDQAGALESIAAALIQLAKKHG
jgi:hypothetical protein